MTNASPQVDPARVGQLLWRARERRRWTREELARAVGLPEARIVAIERGEAQTTYAERNQFAAVLRMRGAERGVFLRGDLLTSAELDAIVLRCAQAGYGYQQIQDTLAEARAERLAERERVAA